MGIATLLIIACHAPVYGVAMPQWMNVILGSGGFGVDIFLFLSGMGIYNSYMKNKGAGEKLEAYLSDRVFAGEKGETIAPDETDVKGFDAFLARYTEGLAIEQAAVEHLQ